MTESRLLAGSRACRSGAPAPDGGRLYAFDNVPGPVAIDAGDGFLEVLDRVAPTWPRRATANEAAWLVRVREERDTYRIETAWSGRHLLKRSAVSAVCAFLVDLVYAGLDDSGLVCLHCAAVEIGGGIIVFPDTYRAGHYAMAAAQEALDQAGWHPESTEDRMRTATAIGTGVGGVPAITDAAETIRTAGVRRLSPFVVPSFLPNLAAGQIAIRFGFHGPAGAPVTACAASAQAIGDALRMIRAEEADIALCGGTEACVSPVAIGGFTAARALSLNYNDEPERASRPFDADHDGFVLSEGAAMLVIERLSHAERRGTVPLAVLSGYGTTTDAHHVTAGWPDGREAARAVEIALAMAGLGSDAIGYVNAHATSTPVGDAAELAALRTVFGDTRGDVAVGSTKSATGHMLGAAGAIEAVFSILALRNNILPPSLNIERPMPEAEGFDLLSDGARPAEVEHVLSNAFGFGGVNAALIFSRWR